MAHFACPPACCALPVCPHLMRPSSPALPPAAIVPVPLLVCPPFCSPRLVCLPVFCALSPAWSCAPSPACPPACCCPHTCPSACLSPLLLSSPRLNPRLTPSLLRSPWLPPLMCLSSPALPPAASAPAPLLAAAQAPGSTLPASADPALPHFAGAAAMNANSGELRRETESAQCCHAAGCCSCVCQLGRSGTQGPRYVMLTALHQLLMRMKYSGSLAHIRICSKYSHGHGVLENVVGGAMSSSEPSPFLVPCLGKGAQVVSPSGF